MSEPEPGAPPPGAGVRAAAAWAVERALARREPLDAFLPALAARLPERDRGLLRELVLGTLRWLRRLEGVVASAAARPLAEIDPPVARVLVVAAYQLLFLDRVPAHAAVDEAVKDARRSGWGRAAGFVNAVARRIARRPELDRWPVEESDPVRRLAVESSHPDFLVRRWWDRFGEERTRRIVAANNRPKRPAVLAFRDRGGREALAGELAAEGVDTRPSLLAPCGLVVERGSPLATPAFAEGRLYLQDEASQAAALVPPPRAGERWLDIAAAPGGKSFAALAFEPGLEVVAADASPRRLAAVRENLVRLRRHLPLAAVDAAAPPFGGRFDRVVLDLPCSGTGTLRKHPELKWRLTPAEIDRLAAVGLRLARGAAAAVASGGLLAVISCSLESEENEELVAALVDAEAELAQVPLQGRLLALHLDGHEAEARWRVDPAEQHDGFTVHVLARR